MCDLFGLTDQQIDKNLKPAFINGGAEHFLLPLKKRSDLASMAYDFDKAVSLMSENNLVTIMLVWQESPSTFHARNAFAIGGVIEDPATGAAAAAFTGYLQKRGLLSNNELTLIQGEDMGMRSLITTKAGASIGEGVTVSGFVRSL